MGLKIFGNYYVTSGLTVGLFGCGGAVDSGSDICGVAACYTNAGSQLIPAACDGLLWMPRQADVSTSLTLYQYIHLRFNSN
jgi:hypothetical protein